MSKSILKKSKGYYNMTMPQKEAIEAMRKLSDGAYKLLVYYYSRNDGWRFSDEKISEAIGTSARQVKKFRKELVDNNYLLIQKGEVDVYFIGEIAVTQFKNDVYVDLDDNIAKDPIIQRRCK